MPRSRLARLALLLGVFIPLATHQAAAYSLSGYKWPTGSNVVFQLGLGAAPKVLTDGSASWNAAVLPALDTWNERMQRIQLSGVDNGGSLSARSGDRVNSVVFSTTVFGQSFGRGTLAVTYYVMQGSSLVEADVLFNVAQAFDSYRGALKFPIGGGTAIADIRRVFLHEVGHGIGLNHYEGDNVMAAMISSREMPSSDDTGGIQALYGAPTSPPPTPTPAPTATPTPNAAPSHLANISTRMKVGLGEDVLIAGFIVSGDEAKRVIFRAIGPSLAAAGITGAIQDPVLELYDSAGNLVRENDDWAAGTQAQEIAATGVAPNSNTESALIATLGRGSYTAVVSGWDNGQGVGMVEAYELDGTSTRMVNLSTRGRIGVGEEALIGGVIVQGSTGKKVIVRALGPSLAGSLAGVLSNPTLELRDGAGNLVGANDNWSSSAQVGEITASGVPPTNALESAVVATLAPGSYTAVVRGVSNGTGVGLVEVFDLQ